MTRLPGVVPVCAGCQFYRHTPDTGSRCYRNAVTQLDVVTGDRVSVGFVDCDQERSYAGPLAWFFHRCGQAGRYFRRRA